MVLDVAAFGPTMFWVFFVNIRCFGWCHWRFRPYGESLFQTPKSNQKAWPRRTALAVARVPSLRGSSGGIASGLLRCTSSRCVWLRQTSLRSHPRISPSTQPADGAGTARSRAFGELTLGHLSGEEHALGFCSSVGASLTATTLQLPAPNPTVGVSLLAMAA